MAASPHDLDAAYFDRVLATLNAYLGPNGALARSLASKGSLRLTRLPRFLPLIIASLLFFTSIHVLVSPICTKILAPRTYRSLRGRRGRNAWNIHVVSMVHALIVVPLASRCLHSPSLAANRIHGWDYDAAIAHSVAVGYFLWDTADAIVNFVDLGFVAHGSLGSLQGAPYLILTRSLHFSMACLLVYGLSYRPFVLYMASLLLWEISTIFLNIHWFLDKLGKTGSTAQKINGALLLASFFGVRILYGGMMSAQFLTELYTIRRDLSTTVWVVYGGGNILLQGLNWFWFFKMIQALQKRFSAGDRLITAADAPAMVILPDGTSAKRKRV
uniref:TLC domain-containing protein n=1 Tax=Schizophyllum commune (strain H4-8 / FGSC 9210) TaxID=578458 RepID=D8PSW9_SCHCM